MKYELEYGEVLLPWSVADDVENIISEICNKYPDDEEGFTTCSVKITIDVTPCVYDNIDE